MAAEKEAHSAALAICVSIASLILSLGTLVALLFSLRQTNAALDVTRATAWATEELAKTQSRAYVQVVNISVARDGGLIVKCQNAGETPSPFFAIGASAMRVPDGQIQHVLKHDIGPLEMKSWVALGAHEPWPAKIDLTQGRADYQAFKNRTLGVRENLLIRGRVIYQDIFGSYFLTEFAFFSDNEAKRYEFLRPFGALAAYKPISREEADALLGQES